MFLLCIIINASTNQTNSRVKNHFVLVSHWFVDKTLSYFEANLDLAAGQTCGSLYAFVEVMKIQKASPHAKHIPMVQPFRDHETKKFTVLDVADIMKITGLRQKTDINKVNSVQSSNWFYVITPTCSAFDEDMSCNSVKLGDL
ncbi:hypothetical protein [Parasitella parasitica]|uniref:Uncharacterized protein n=1 Tax=Parasitella parasitica TaxID=35722 RepID=A0A0B7N2C4_9FUNG|nr:hypothetical protein [Parasitella parasitica]